MPVMDDETNLVFDESHEKVADIGLDQVKEESLVMLYFGMKDMPGPCLSVGLPIAGIDAHVFGRVALEPLVLEEIEQAWFPEDVPMLHAAAAKFREWADKIEAKARKADAKKPNVSSTGRA